MDSEMKIDRKRGQVTIFILLGILIVAGLIIGYIIYRNYYAEAPEAVDFTKELDACVQDVMSASIDKISLTGGISNPVLFERYQDQKYSYLCYSQNFKEQCVNQYPSLQKVVQEELIKDSKEGIDKCFSSLKTRLESKGYDINEGKINTTISLASKKVLVKIQKKFDLSRQGSARSFRELETEVLSPSYDFILVAQRIVNDESEFCNFDYNGFTLLYPEYKIDVFKYNYAKLYTITERVSNKKFAFAIRACALPGGI